MGTRQEDPNDTWQICLSHLVMAPIFSPISCTSTKWWVPAGAATAYMVHTCYHVIANSSWGWVWLWQHLKEAAISSVPGEKIIIPLGGICLHCLKIIVHHQFLSRLPLHIKYLFENLVQRLIYTLWYLKVPYKLELCYEWLRLKKYHNVKAKAGQYNQVLHYLKHQLN